ncbi:MAG: Fur family transcriptional regulator [Deltaproteobacteria bacterium]|nr:Fur family transcriptional regulator [Deltaproteobacteria bacterium]HCH65446.1 transcriptional repressor [Deltaproteobacteria bacterium]
MSITKDKARRLLRENSLRVTGPRLAVIEVLAEANKPLSYGEVLKRMGSTDWDPATVYRNLVKLREAGLAPVVSRAAGSDRYVFSPGKGAVHRHPHFVCDDCGEVSCLPTNLTSSISMEGPWAVSIQQAAVQLRGECPDCMDRKYLGRT